MIEKLCVRKDLEGSDRGLTEAISLYLTTGTEEDHKIFESG
jgi:hypothetical protein